MSIEIVAKALDIPVAKHPLDGGTHVARGFDCGDGILEALKEAKIKSILSIEKLQIMSYDTYEMKNVWKVRGIFE